MRIHFYLDSRWSICTSRPFSNTTVSPYIITISGHNTHISQVGGVLYCFICTTSMLMKGFCAKSNWKQNAL